MKRVLVADDHPIVLQGIMMLLAPLRLAVVARCSNGAEALEAALRLKPDMAILDQSMPPLSGIDVALRLRQEGLPTKVLLLTAVVDRGGTVAAMAAAEGLRFAAVLSAPELGFDYEGGS